MNLTLEDVQEGMPGKDRIGKMWPQENTGPAKNKTLPLVLVGKCGQALKQFLKFDYLSIRKPLKALKEDHA